MAKRIKYHFDLLISAKFVPSHYFIKLLYYQIFAIHTKHYMRSFYPKYWMAIQFIELKFFLIH